MEVNDVLTRLAEAIIAGDRAAARERAEQAMASGIAPMAAMNDGVMAATETLGARFQEGDLYLPELILAAGAAKAAMAVLTPHLTKEQQAATTRGKVVLGTVSGDVHDIGKNLVGAVLAARGFEVHDIGIDAPPRRFVNKAEEVGASIIALSCLMSNSLLYQQDVIEYLKGSGRRDRYFVIVGGGPVTPDWAAAIGADGYARDATQAAEVCNRLVSAEARPPLPQPLLP